MTERLHFPETAAAGYDDHVGQSSGREFNAVSVMIAARKARSVHGGQLGDRVTGLFAAAGFRQIETEAYSGMLIMPSLDAYVRSIEAGAG